MPRFAFTFFLLLLVGCQTAGRGPQKTVLVNSSQQTPPAKTFWIRTAKLFQPLMPDRGNHTAGTASQVAAQRSAPDILPINQTAHSLYKAGSIFPSAALAPQTPETNDTVAKTTVNTPLERPNPLLIQSGDSEAFKSLLREIAIMPPEKRKVDDAKLTELLGTFRDEIMDTDFEAEYLALLQKRILPEPKSGAPLPQAALSNTELAETRRSASTTAKSRESEMDDNDFAYEEPIARPVTRKTPRNEEPVVAQSTMPMPEPVYPYLSQLPTAPSTAAPAVVQASYQSQSIVPPTPNIVNNGIVSHGAGDWQAPTRAAIEQLRYAIEQTPNGRTASNEMRLRMLEMLLDNKTEAARPMHSTDKVVNNFFGHQVLGFAALLDDSMQDNRSRYLNAAYRFNEGLSELQNLCPVTLKNATFVTDWVGYGQFYPHPTQEFYPGEVFYVYMEIENPSARRTPDGFEVNYAIGYEIRDAHKVVFRQEAKEEGEMSLRRKRDYWIPIGGTIPASLAPGQYQLRINLTDLNGDSMQDAVDQIPFRVAPSLRETGNPVPANHGGDGSPPPAGRPGRR